MPLRGDAARDELLQQRAEPLESELVQNRPNLPSDGRIVLLASVGSLALLMPVSLLRHPGARRHLQRRDGLQVLLTPHTLRRPSQREARRGARVAGAVALGDAHWTVHRVPGAGWRLADRDFAVPNVRHTVHDARRRTEVSACLPPSQELADRHDGGRAGLRHDAGHSQERLSHTRNLAGLHWPQAHGARQAADSRSRSPAACRLRPAGGLLARLRFALVGSAVLG
mmetsp:Transcript_70747/g.218522  ORF Transcript_70747/g.218522 Transcript_70747/m.218522 type:complete len:226 (-) Transcript_70747:282-959(-)